MFQSKINITDKPSNYQVIAPENSLINYDDNGLSLVDIWLILTRYAKLILISTIATVFASILYLLSASNVYEVTGLISVGKVSLKTGTSKLESEKDIISKYDGKHSVNVAYIKRNGYVEVSATGQEPEKVFTSVKMVLDEIVTSHNARYDQLIENQKLKTSLMKEELGLILANLNELKNLKTRLKNVEKLDVLRELRVLQSRRTELLTALSNLAQIQSDNFRTNIISTPSIPDTPISPRKALVVTMALISGLLLAGFLIFVLEFRQKIRSVEVKKS